MTERKPATAERVTRTLAKPLIQAGVRREPGEEVALRPEQIERLEPEGYFEPLEGGKGGRK